MLTQGAIRPACWASQHFLERQPDFVVAGWRGGILSGVARCRSDG